MTKSRLWYLKIKELTRVAYTDAYWVGNLDEKRSTSGASFYVGDYLVS